jgi:hypothetical protein
MEASIILKSRNASRFAVNNIFTVAFCSKCNHVSRSRFAVNGITVMDIPYSPHQTQPDVSPRTMGQDYPFTRPSPGDNPPIYPSFPALA